jgi:single-strand DNA-binding protein
MASLNKVMLIGRLGTDPEKRVTQSGSSVVSLSLATTDYYKDQQGNKQEKTEWHKVVLWNRLADLAEQYLGKGRQVYVEGSLRTNEWKDKDGNKRYTKEVIGQTIQFIDSQQAGNNNEQSSNSGFVGRESENPLGADYDSAQVNKSNIQDNFIDDDIPF